MTHYFLEYCRWNEKKLNKPPFIEYRKDRNNVYFKSNYEMRTKLYAYIYDNFFTTDPNKVLPFLDRWMFDHAGLLYRAILRDSNYAELQPEKIFLMDNEELFVSSLKQYFIHYCEKDDHHRCLNPT
ncbi:MAG: Lpg0189 family type II secretion system effector [Legionella sp.]